MAMIGPRIPDFDGAPYAAEESSSEGLTSNEMDEIDAMFGRLGEGPYALLGVARDATRPEVRSAYFERMKRFHPEVFGDRELSLYRPRVEAIHAALTEAFATLCDAQRRSSLDAALDAEAARRAAPKAEPRAPRPVTGVVARAPQAPAAPSPPPRVTTRPARAPDSKPAPVSAAPPRASEVPADREEAPVPREVTQQSLARARAEHILKQRVERAAELDAQAREAQARGDEVAMASLLRQSLTLMPDNEDVKRRLEEYEGRRASAAHDRFVIAARTHERDRRWDAAFAAWMKALHERPSSLPAHLGAVGAACEGLLDLQGAADLARKATQLDPKSADAQAGLARVFFLAGRMASARGAAEAALRLDPDHAVALDLARRLKAR
ncbi:MAG: J domain-containing protein [Polyangiales bacterium]